MDVPIFPINGYIRRFIYCAHFFLFSSFSHADLQALTDRGLASITAQADIPSIPLLDGVDFDVQSSGLEIDIDVQASIGSIEWRDDDGFIEGSAGGGLILRGVHIGSSSSPITGEQVMSSSPFSPTDLAQISGMLIEADPKKGTLITLNRIGDTLGNGIDIIVSDIYFGRDSFSQGERGLGLLIEDLSNFVSDAYLTRINQKFGLNLSSIDDGFDSQGGNYYPLKFRMQPLEGGDALGVTSDSPLGNLPGFGLTGQTSMVLDAQFLLYVDKLAVFKDGREAGIKGLLVYQGVDTNNDGIEDTVGPATLSNLKMETIQHQLADGSSVQAMHFSNIDFKADIAMENIYLGNPETGSLGAVHIDNLHIHDTQMWIYARE